MMKKKWLIILVVVISTLLLTGNQIIQAKDNPGDFSLEPQGGPNEPYGFSYQGRLDDGGEPANGIYDFIIELWDLETIGNKVADCIDTSGGLDDRVVTDGLFAFYLVCGDNWNNSEIFTGEHLWVQVRVRPNGSGTYTQLPRQPIAPAPYAWSLYPGAIISGTISGIELGDSIVNMYNDTGTGLHASTEGGEITDYGVHGQANGLSYGIFGENISSVTGGLGVYGKNAGGGSGVSGFNNGSGNGTWGYSVGYNGVGGGTSRVDSNYGLYTADNLYSLNYHTMGAIMQVAQNGSSEILERGDVVAIMGMGHAPSADLPPIMQVGKTTQANSSAVIGVVYSTYSIEWLQPMQDITGANTNEDIPLSTDTSVAPGEYMLIVVQGPAEVKASAVSGSIQPGDLLSASNISGHAAKASEMTLEGSVIAPPGSVIGKALEAMTEEKQLIYIFVTLQ